MQNYVLCEINKLFEYLVQDQKLLANELHITINKRIHVYILVCQKFFLPKLEHLKSTVKERFFEEKYISTRPSASENRCKLYPP